MRVTAVILDKQCKYDAIHSSVKYVINVDFMRIGMHVKDAFFVTSVEAEVTFDYEAQQDDELTLKVWDVITDIAQVGFRSNSFCSLPMFLASVRMMIVSSLITLYSFDQ